MFDWPISKNECITILLLFSANRQFYQQLFAVILIVGQSILCRKFQGGLIAANIAAFFALVSYYIAFFGVGLAKDGHEKSQAIRSSVAGVYINVYRTQTPWTMISAGLAQRHDLETAIFTNKACIVFCKTLYLHVAYFLLSFSMASQRPLIYAAPMALS